MANLTESSTWEPGIYQLETTDPVEGGALGVSNTQARLLGNRTKWLYDAIGVLNAWRITVDNFIANTKFLLFLAKGTVSIGNIVANKTVTVNFPNVGTSNYMVNGSLVSLSANYLQDIQCTWMIKNKTNTSFQVIVSEMTGENQNLNFDYTLIPL